MDLIRNLKPRTIQEKTGNGMGRLLALSALPVLLCWFFGLPALALGIWVMYRLWKLRPAARRWKGRPGTLYRLSWPAAASGTLMAGLFTVYYILALSYGAYFRW